MTIHNNNCNLNLVNIYFIKNLNNKNYIKIETQANNLNNSNKILFIIKDMIPEFKNFLYIVCQNYYMQNGWFDFKCIKFLLKKPFYKKYMIPYFNN
jgi:hypothetical protein